MKIEIKSLAGSVLFEGDFASVADCLVAAVRLDANLADANLAGADLADANLADANLAGADLAGAYLAGAKHAELAIAKTRILPAGALIVWKKLRHDMIAKLRIPEGAKRSHAFGRKCRAEFAEVLEITDRDGKAVASGTSLHDACFEYLTGATVKPTSPFSDNWQDECESGIHFFITREEALAHA